MHPQIVQCISFRNRIRRCFSPKFAAHLSGILISIPYKGAGPESGLPAREHEMATLALRLAWGNTAPLAALALLPLVCLLVT